MLLVILTIMVISLVYFIMSGHTKKSRINKAIGYTLAGVLLTFGVTIVLTMSTTTNYDEETFSSNVEVIKIEDNQMEEMQKPSS